MTANAPPLPVWKRLLSKWAKDAVDGCNTPEDVRRLGEKYFLHLLGISASTVNEIGTTIGGWDDDPQLGAPPSDTPPPLPLPAGAAVPGHLEELAETARNYARGAKSANTLRAYATDWHHYEAWCLRKDLEPLPTSPQVVGLYLAACAAAEPLPGRKPGSVRTIERRLSAICWTCAQRGQPLDRADRHIREVMQGIRRKHGRPPDEKEAVLGEDVIRMAETLGHDLRGLRDRAILLIGFAGGLRRSEIVGLDLGLDQTKDGTGWVEFLEEGLLIRVRGKTGWREVEIGRGSTERTCPVTVLKTWLELGRIVHGPVFRRITGDGKKIGTDRLNDRHIARLVKRTVLAAGVRGDLSEAARREKFSGHSLRAGLASSAEVDERFTQKQLGHASPVMTRRYHRRRERFRANLTKAAGL
jgi:integrase